MSHEMAPEAAFETLSEGIGRRDLLRAATAIGAGAIAPAWMLSPGVDEVAAQAGGDGPGPRILQSGRGRRPGSYITSTPERSAGATCPTGPPRRSAPCARARW